MCALSQIFGVKAIIFKVVKFSTDENFMCNLRHEDAWQLQRLSLIVFDERSTCCGKICVHFLIFMV